MLQDNVCSLFQNYFQRMDHSQNTGNINLVVKAPRMKAEFGRKSFCVTAANVYSSVPILARKLDSRVFFRAHLDDLLAFLKLFS